ncbi:MAG: hypothetical protein KU37_03810 [Sulfuricurvum sp. PC08-66]|nr:MAG: hypothetical protein KU37_03810 [Sulfuricurvum sp. PC08-66]
MSLKFKVIFSVSVLLMGISIVLSVMNYRTSVATTQTQLRETALPLSIDNIYGEIQKNIIEPNLVASMMANDTFVKAWIAEGEKEPQKIATYLHAIQERYGFLSTFLVSETSMHYYTPKGAIDTLKSTNPENQWYYRFKAKEVDSEINLDSNHLLDNSMIMFINNKIYDAKGSMMGATGVALKIAYLEEMLRYFHEKYHFNVLILDSRGKILLHNEMTPNYQTLLSPAQRSEIEAKIFTQTQKVFEFKSGSDSYLMHSKYIDGLDFYVVVEAKLDTFIQETKANFYKDIILSMGFAVLIIFIIFYTVNIYQRQLEYLVHHDTLTGLDNRRTFNEGFVNALQLFEKQSKPFGMIFIDIDDFKKINDTLGHVVGDSVLARVAQVLTQSVQKGDAVARWGGEEFAILCRNHPIDAIGASAKGIAEAIKLDAKLCEIAQGRVTVSVGVTVVRQGDTMDTMTSRVDEALYSAKNSGKDSVVYL